MSGLEVTTLESAAAAGNSPLRAGDVIHLETPVNPTGEARSIAFYAALAHQTGAYLVVDSTFGPPGLQDPFEWGADVVMHSGTKYLGGHSDLLCGVLATRKGEWARALKEDRTVLGSVLGGMEAWLCMRGLRTLSVRVERASSNAGQLVGWLESERAREGSAISRTVTGVAHASLQPEAAVQGSWLRRQMPLGYGGVFAIVLREREMARRLPGCLKLFRHATSLGGVESLIEWRAMSDDAVEEGLVRVSVGIEDWRDLKADLQAGFEEVVRLPLLSGLT